MSGNRPGGQLPPGTILAPDDSFANNLRALIAEQRHQEAGQKPYRVRMSWAWYTGKCGCCDRPLEPKEPITLCHVSAEGWKPALGPFPVCHACMEIPSERRLIAFEIYGRRDRPLIQVPCEGCARPVILRLGSDRLHVTCCEACHDSMARHRTRPMPQACAFCGEAFSPSRPDEAFCTIRCEQNAFGQRHRSEAIAQYTYQSRKIYS